MSENFKSIKCPDCGADLKSGAGKSQIFCIHCGRKILLSNENRQTSRTTEQTSTAAAQKSRETVNKAKQTEVMAQSGTDSRKMLRMLLIACAVLIVMGSLFSVKFLDRASLILLIYTFCYWLNHRTAKGGSGETQIKTDGQTTKSVNAKRSNTSANTSVQKGNGNSGINTVNSASNRSLNGTENTSEKPKAETNRQQTVTENPGKVYYPRNYPRSLRRRRNVQTPIFVTQTPVSAPETEAEPVTDTDHEFAYEEYDTIDFENESFEYDNSNYSEDEEPKIDYDELYGDDYESAHGLISEECSFEEYVCLREEGYDDDAILEIILESDFEEGSMELQAMMAPFVYQSMRLSGVSHQTLEEMVMDDIMKEEEASWFGEE